MLSPGGDRLDVRHWRLPAYDLAVKVVFYQVMRNDMSHDPLAVPACLCYRQDQPYTAFLVFQEQGKPESFIVWEFGRDLIDAGRREPAGEPEGMVQVFPFYQPGSFRMQIGFRLVGKDVEDGSWASVVLTAPLNTINFYLRKAYELVPQGNEPKYMSDSINQTIAQLLHNEE